MLYLYCNTSAYMLKLAFYFRYINEVLFLLRAFHHRSYNVLAHGIGAVLRVVKYSSDNFDDDSLKGSGNF